MMTSGLGRMMAPSRSVYGLTKWALQGFSDALRYEMKPFGVQVCLWNVKSTPSHRWQFVYLNRLSFLILCEIHSNFIEVLVI